MELPVALQDAFSRGHGALFVGAGASVDAGMPTWQKLSTELARHISVSEIQDKSATVRFVQAIPQYFENEHGRAELLGRVRELIPLTKGPSAIHQLLAKVKCSLYYTTNYDILLESALQAEGTLTEVIVGEAGARANPRRDRCQVRKIHGSIHSNDPLILTRTDFASYERLHPIVCDQLKLDLAAQTFLFVGYSLTDPDFNSIYDDFIARYSPLNRHHYITVFGIDKHEARDLRMRGLHTIDLAEWGRDPGEGLRTFLGQLCEATTEAFHIQRFFRDLDREEITPIVIPSAFDRDGTAVTYHHSDLQVQVAVAGALTILGQRSTVHADKLVLGEADDLLRDNVILIGSPSGNYVTRRLFERLDEGRAGNVGTISTRFEFGDGERTLTDATLRFSFTAPDPALRRTGNHRRNAKEYALIARYPNPWATGKWIFLLAGLWGMGTHVVGDFLHDASNFEHLPWQDERAVAVLEASYKHFDPFRPNYKTKLVWRTT